MKLSYEGIGEWSATFACTGVENGMVVKMKSACTVAPCTDGDAFCGVVTYAARDAEACAVQLAGMTTVGYTGAAPAVGWTGLAADGTGGVKTAEGAKSRLVVDVDQSAKTVTLVL